MNTIESEVIMKRIKEKIVSILWRIWGYIHNDIYRCVEVYSDIKDAARLCSDEPRHYVRPKFKNKVDFVEDTSKTSLVNENIGYSYLYRRWDYKLRRVFNLSCREKGRLGIGRKGEPRIITRWKKLCDGFCDFVTELEYKWDV
jgi:hypothetical protein